MEERLEKLELLFMQQEQTIETLSRQLYLQQQEIARALHTIERLSDKLKALEPSLLGNPQDEPPPPHY